MHHVPIHRHLLQDRVVHPHPVSLREVHHRLFLRPNFPLKQCVALRDPKSQTSAASLTLAALVALVKVLQGRACFRLLIFLLYCFLYANL